MWLHGHYMHQGMNRFLSRALALLVAVIAISTGVVSARPGLLAGPATESVPIITSLGAGASHTCMVRDAAVWCTGDNTFGQLGTGDYERTYAFAQTKVSNATSVSAGGNTSCAVLTDTSVTCWGALPAAANSPLPTPVPLTGVASVSVGTQHVCALMLNGNVWCWGNNGSGRLGNGNKISSATPVQVGISSVVSLSAGAVHTCATKTNKTVLCWGSNGYYRLGRLSPLSQTRPRLVPKVRAVSVSVGSGFTCIVNTSKRAMCWGRNNYGQQGVKPGKSRLAPRTMSLREVVSVSAGEEFVCASTSVPETWCWGRARYGQLANASNISRYTPQRIIAGPEVGQVLSVETGLSHACATTMTQGAMWCWGYGVAGQLGDSSRSNRTSGTAVWPNGVRYKAIGSDTAATLVLAGDISCNATRKATYGVGPLGSQCGEATTAAQISAIAPHAVMALGDLQYEAASYSDLLTHYDPTWGLFKSITYPVRGNHEYITPGANGYIQYFGNMSASYWTTNAAGWRIIGVDSWCVGVVTDGCSATSHQTRWLTEQLALAKSENKCSMVLMHHPPFSSGLYPVSSAKPLWDASVNGGADVMFTAHDHHYERFEPLGVDGIPSATGTALFISGLGGAQTYPLLTPAPGSAFRFNDEHGVVKLDLTPTTYTWSFMSASTNTILDTGTATCSPAS